MKKQLKACLRLMTAGIIVLAFMAQAEAQTATYDQSEGRLVGTVKTNNGKTLYLFEQMEEGVYAIASYTKKGGQLFRRKRLQSERQMLPLHQVGRIQRLDDHRTRWRILRPRQRRQLALHSAHRAGKHQLHSHLLRQISRVSVRRQALRIQAQERGLVAAQGSAFLRIPLVCRSVQRLSDQNRPNR